MNASNIGILLETLVNWAKRKGDENALHNAKVDGIKEVLITALNKNGAMEPQPPQLKTLAPTPPVAEKKEEGEPKPMPQTKAEEALNGLGVGAPLPVVDPQNQPPFSVLWHQNKKATVLAQDGTKLDKYSCKSHAETRDKLVADGIDWQGIISQSTPDFTAKA